MRCFVGLQPSRKASHRLPLGCKGIDQRILVRIAQRHAADQHFVVSRANVRQHDAREAIPCGLRASVQATGAGCDHHVLQEHAVVEQRAASHDFIDREHQAHGRIEETVILLMLQVHLVFIALSYAKHAVQAKAARTAAVDVP